MKLLVGLFRWLTFNWGWKLVALLIAMLLWLTVASEPELATFTSVPVEFKNLPPDLEISSPVVESVYLELRGPAGELRNFSDTRRSAVVFDLSGVHPGEQTFTIGKGDVVMPRALRLVRAVPSQMRFEFQRLTSARVPVQVRFSRPPPDSYQIASYTVTPPVLEITGPESHVAQVRNAWTDAIDLSAVVAEKTFRANVYVNDPQVRFQTAPQVVVNVTIKKSETKP